MIGILTCGAKLRFLLGHPLRRAPLASSRGGGLHEVPGAGAYTPNHCMRPARAEPAFRSGIAATAGTSLKYHTAILCILGVRKMGP